MKPPILLKLLRQISPKAATRKSNSEAGFSLIEILVVVLIIGILSAIAAPGWLAFTNRQRLRTSTDRVYSALRRAQSEAKLNKETWQVSFWQTDIDGENRVLWGIHPTSSAYDDPTTALPVASASDGLGAYKWHPLEQGVEMDTDASSLTETTLATVPDITEEVYKMQFSYKGNAKGKRGKITLLHTNMGDNRRCVIVSTLLGALRTDENDGCEKEE